MSEERRIVTCRRSNEGQDLAAKAGCVERFCETCARGVWVSPNTFHFMAAKPEIKWQILCNGCANPIIQNAGEGAVFIRSLPEPIARFMDWVKSFESK